jgi:hypothetical protein
MNRETVLLDFYRETASKFRAETERVFESPAKYIDADRSIEPSTGVTLYDRVRKMRALFIADFPRYGAGLPSLSYQPTLDPNDLPNRSLDRNDLRALMSGLDKFVQILPHRVSSP